MRIPPPHPLPIIFLAVEACAPLLEAVDDRECSLLVAGSLERNRQVPLRAPVIDLHPAFLAHVEPPGVRLGRRAGERHVFLEETPGVEREGADRREHGFLHLLRPPLLLDEPVVEPRHRAHRRLHVDLDAARPQPAEAGDDPERDRVARAPSREPRPATVGVAERVEPGERRLHLVRRAIGVEQECDPGPGLLLIHRLAHPRRLGEERSHEVRVLLQRALQGLRALPLFEHLRDPRVTGGEVPRKRVGVEPREQRLNALVARLHNRWQTEHGIPGRIRRRLDHERLALDRVGRLREPLDHDPLLTRPAHRDRHSFGHKHPPRQHRQHCFFTIARCSS